MLPEQQPASSSRELEADVAGIDTSLRVIAAALTYDPNEPEMGYYAAELHTLRAAMLRITDGDHAS